MRFLICYDISDHKLRAKVAKLLKNFCVRIQYSVFMANLSEVCVKEMKSEIKKILQGRQDYSLFICPVDRVCWGNLWHIGKETVKDEYIII